MATAIATEKIAATMKATVTLIGNVARTTVTADLDALPHLYKWVRLSVRGLFFSLTIFFVGFFYVHPFWLLRWIMT